MAKKKGTSRSNANVTVTDDDNRQSHNQNNSQETETVISRGSSMEEEHDASDEKLKNLKSLNELLLKQTVEKRLQIDSLVMAKDELATELANELARFGTEKTGLTDELGQVSDENLELKIELGIVMDVVKNRFREIGVGVERLIREKDDKESEIRVLKREANRLKENVIRLEEKEMNLDMVIVELRSENDRLVKEMRIIEEVKKEKIVLEKTIEDKKKEIDGLKIQIEAIENEMEIAKIEQRGGMEELQRKLEKLNETVLSLTKEGKVSRDLVIELEKNLDESIEKERAMMVQIDALEKEKTIKESEVERLMEEKHSTEKQMEMVNVESSDKVKFIEQLSQEKIKLEERVVTQEAKFVELNQKADELRHSVDVLQKDCDDRAKTNEKLVSKVGELSDALAQVEVKREEADKALDEEKKRGEDLKAVVLTSETKIQTTLEVLEKTMKERESLLTEKKDLECQFESLRNEKDILENGLVELKNARDALRTKLESTETVARQSLVMLKSAASIVSRSENREDGTESYELELESIEKAFRNKEDIILEMQQSMEKAHKKKNFWTLVSSVTTVFAAASFAYAARKPRNGFAS